MTAKKNESTDLCWARVVGYPFWPAKRISPDKAPQHVLRSHHRQGQTLVKFYGPEVLFGWMDEHEVLSFRGHFQEKSRPPKGKSRNSFKKAVEQAEEAEKRREQGVQSDDDNNLQEQQGELEGDKLDDDSQKEGKESHEPKEQDHIEEDFDEDYNEHTKKKRSKKKTDDNKEQKSKEKSQEKREHKKSRRRKKHKKDREEKNRTEDKKKSDSSKRSSKKRKRRHNDDDIIQPKQKKRKNEKISDDNLTTGNTDKSENTDTENVQKASKSKQQTPKHTVPSLEKLMTFQQGLRVSLYQDKDIPTALKILEKLKTYEYTIELLKLSKIGRIVNKQKSHKNTTVAQLSTDLFSQFMAVVQSSKRQKQPDIVKDSNTEADYAQNNHSSVDTTNNGSKTINDQEKELIDEPSKNIPTQQ